MRNLASWIDTAHFTLWSNVHAFPAPLRALWQRNQLDRTRAEAQRNVPFYRSCAQNTDAMQFPIVTKQHFRIEPQRFLHTHYPLHLCEWKETSGSTGVPLRFPISSFYARSFRDRRYLAFSRYRFLAWQHRSFSDIRERVRKTRLVHIGIRPHHSYPQHSLFVAIEDLRADPLDALTRIRAFKPDMVESLPSGLTELALAHSGEPLTFPLAYSAGELLTDANRRRIERAFNCEVFNVYGLEEVGMVALECAQHDGQHVSEESFLVEIVDETGRALPDGTYGRVVLTYFWNDAMPFIRYDTGDRGTLVAEPCPCGVPSKRLRIDGRQGGHVTIRGKRFYYYEFTHAMEGFHADVAQFQWVLGEPPEIRILASSRMASDAPTRIAAHMYAHFGFTPRVTTEPFILRNGKIPLVAPLTV